MYEARLATPAAWAVAALSVAYAIVFFAVVRPSNGANTGGAILSDTFILLSGILVTIVATTAGERIGGVEGSWVKLMGVGWALLSATHGAYALVADLDQLDIPQVTPTDPRGFATFGLAGLWMIVVGLLVRQGRGGLPRGLGALGIAAGVDLVLLFIATVAGSSSLVPVFGGLASVILGPAFWMWMGSALRTASY